MWRYHPIAGMTVDFATAPVEPLDHDLGDEWDLGDCQTTVVDASNGLLRLADWRPLMKDPAADPPIDAWTTPDRATVFVQDRTYTIDHFYPRADGTADVFGSVIAVPPNPVPGTPAFVDGCQNPVGESGQPNSTLSLWRAFYDWAGEREFFVGMVDPSLHTEWGGMADGDVDTAWVRMNPSWSDEAPWYLGGAGTFAHEVGHLTGLKHVACADFNDDLVPDEKRGGATDPTHPQEDRFPSCSLAEVREHGYYGFDVYWDLFGLPEPAIISNNPAAPEVSRAYPLLGYWAPRWIDPFHYCRLLVYYGVPCDPAGIDEPFSPPSGPADEFWTPQGHGDPLPDPGFPLLLAAGSVDVEAGTGGIDGLGTVIEPTQDLLERLARQGLDAPAPGSARLVARDAAGVERYAATIVDRTSAEEKGPSIPFNLVVPLDPAVVGVAVEAADGSVLARLPISPNAPTARWTSLQPGARELGAADRRRGPGRVHRLGSRRRSPDRDAPLLARRRALAGRRDGPGRGGHDPSAAARPARIRSRTAAAHRHGWHPRLDRHRRADRRRPEPPSGTADRGSRHGDHLPLGCPGRAVGRRYRPRGPPAPRRPAALELVARRSARHGPRDPHSRPVIRPPRDHADRGRLGRERGLDDGRARR